MNAQQVFNSALLAAKAKGAVDLAKFGNYVKQAATATDLELEAMSAELQKAVGGSTAASGPSLATRQLFQVTLSRAAEVGAVHSTEVAQYQTKFQNQPSDDALLSLIGDLENKIKRLV